MSLHISGELQEALAPVFDVLPIEEAMTALVVREGVAPKLIELVGQRLEEPFWQAHPSLCAGLWLYVDGLDESHAISQKLPGPTGAFWHGIMHRREGDFGNAKYWFHQATGHPVLGILPDYNPFEFVEDVQAAVDNAPELVARQREEWSALMEWCFENPGR